MKNIQLIIFDFDGTLCDSKMIIVRTLQNTLKELNYPMSDDETCAATIGLPLEECFRQLVPTLSDDDARICALTYRRLFEEAKLVAFPNLFPHVMETIQALYQRGLKLAIASSRAQRSLLLFCEKYGMMEYVDEAIGSDNVKHAKPEPDPVLYFLEKYHIDAGNTLVVGDMTFDILMGARAGAHTCGVTYGNGTHQELQDCNAEYIFDDIAKILDIIE